MDQIKCPNKQPRNLLHWIILKNCALFSFISMNILLVKPFPMFSFYLLIWNNSCGNFLSWKFFLAILSVFLALFICYRLNCKFNSYFFIVSHQKTATLPSADFSLFCLLRQIHFRPCLQLQHYHYYLIWLFLQQILLTEFLLDY